MSNRGDRADVVYGAWYNAEKSWNSGKYLHASGETLQAFWMTIDFDARIVISKPFYWRSRALEKRGQLKEAIDSCMAGAKIIGQYDMEGEWWYHCFELQMQYHKALPDSNLASPTAKP